MNLADACERKTYADGACIIKQVSLADYMLLCAIRFTPGRWRWKFLFGWKWEGDSYYGGPCEY